MKRLLNRMLIIGLLAQVSFANTNQTKHRENTILFSIYKNYLPLTIEKSTRTNNVKINDLLNRYNAIKIEPWLKAATENDFDGDIYLNRIYRITFDSKNKIDFNKITQELNSIDEVQIIERENIHKVYYNPNDNRYDDQWFLEAINSNDAWNYWNINGGEIPGDKSIILASVDTGVNWRHVDLINNIYQNLGEDADGDGRTLEYIGGQWVLDPGDLNGIDDDNWDNQQSTFIDDLIGWDVTGPGDNDPDPPHTSGWSHGTHVAGLLAATTNNNTGISSTAFNSSILPVKCTGDNDDNNYITDGYGGVLYAAKMGHHAEGFVIINCSWGGGEEPSFFEESTINTVYNNYNAVIFAASGNGEEDGWGEDYSAHYPSSYDNVISVTAIGTNASWGHWATYHESVDLSAPGEGILSTTIGGGWGGGNANTGYQSWEGTSMASPVAASCAGLLKSYNPSWNNEKIKTMLLATANPVIYNVNSESYLEGRLGRGQIDMLKAISTPLFPKIEIADQDIYIVNDNNNEINIGESVDYMAILFNDPDWGNATNTTLALSSDNSCISFENNNVGIGDIDSGEAGINEIPITIEFGPTCQPGTFNIDVEITSNQNGYVGYKTLSPLSLTLNDLPILLGDVTGNSAVDVADIVVTINIILDNTNPTSAQITAADINQDNVINIQDIILIVNIILDN